MKASRTVLLCTTLLLLASGCSRSNTPRINGVSFDPSIVNRTISTSTPQDTATKPIEVLDRTVAGVEVCLEDKDPSKPKAEKCTNGLKGDDGKYYALNFSTTTASSVSFGVGKRLNATGMLFPVVGFKGTPLEQFGVEGLLSVTEVH